MAAISLIEREYFSDPMNVDAEIRDYERISVMVPRDIVHELMNEPLFQPLMITWAGFYSHAGTHVAERLNDQQFFPDYILHYCDKGSGFQKVGDVYTTISAGDLSICHANMPHQYGSNPSDPWDIYWACFKGSHVEPLLAALGLSKERPLISLGINTPVKQSFYHIFEVLKRPPSANHLYYAASLFGCMLAQLASQHQYQERKVTAGFNADEVISFMYHNLHASVELNDFADYFGMSKYYFNRRFREITGHSVIEYYNRLKLNKACDLLTSTNQSIQEISQSLNFCNPYYFSQRFKEMLGFSPSQYRKSFSSNGATGYRGSSRQI